MHRALQLAALGRGNVSPNPMVGCVIVHNDLIIGEGFHRKYGDAHAEVNAVNSVKNKDLLPEATVYVTLEPCSHFGKTPPCADLLIKYQVKKVVICNFDPNPLVAGKGIEKLQNADIEVVTNVLEDIGRKLNARFFTFIEKKRPYIILKWAETADGFIAGENFEQIKISNALSHKLSHKWRSEEDSIMVGKNTALYDKPQLTVREWTGRNPVIIAPPPTPPRWGGGQNLPENDSGRGDDGGAYSLPLGAAAVAEGWGGAASLIIEGGAKLLQSFMNEGLFDEIRVFRSKKQLFKGIAAPILPKNIIITQRKNLLGDELTFYENLPPTPKREQG